MVYPISEGSFLLISTILVKTDRCQEESDSCSLWKYNPVPTCKQAPMGTSTGGTDYTSFVVWLHIFRNLTTHPSKIQLRNVLIINEMRVSIFSLYYLYSLKGMVMDWNQDFSVLFRPSSLLMKKDSKLNRGRVSWGPQVEVSTTMSETRQICSRGCKPVIM